MPFSRLDLGDTTQLRIRVVRDPMPLLISLLADVYGERPQGVPAAWRRMVRDAAPVHAAAVLSPIFSRDTPMMPDCISPRIHDHLDPAVDLERIGDADGGVLLAEVHRMFGDDLPGPWRRVGSAPERWLGLLALVMREAWTAFEPVWRRASALFDREAERVGSAVVRGVPETVLVGLGPRHRYADGTLLIEDRHPEPFSLGRRTLVLVPVISSTTPSLCELDDPESVWLGYGMPGQGQLYGEARPGAPAKDALGVALGPPRALIMRLLKAPATMSEIAGWIEATAPAATHHCRRLEDAGLLVRHRRGSHT